MFDIEVSSIQLEEIEAKAIYAFNPATHQVYIGRNETAQLPVASITKLMTALVVLERWAPEELLTAGEYDEETLEWYIDFEPGDQITVEDALKAMLISSYNDAAYLVAGNYEGGMEAFVARMNELAQKLGMENTHFANPAGLDDQMNYSTAQDIAKLVKKVASQPEILQIVGNYTESVQILREEELLTIPIRSTNQLLGTDPYLVGLKTGFTADAGPSFVSYYDAGGDSKLVTVILNSENDRFEETAELVEILRSAYR